MIERPIQYTLHIFVWRAQGVYENVEFGAKDDSQEDVNDNNEVNNRPHPGLNNARNSPAARDVLNTRNVLSNKDVNAGLRRKDAGPKDALLKLHHHKDVVLKHKDVLKKRENLTKEELLKWLDLDYTQLNTALLLKHQEKVAIAISMITFFIVL